MAIATIAVIDYEMGNLHSACKGLEQVGADVTILQHPNHLERYDGLLLPGVGSFDPAIESLRKHGFEEPIKAAIARNQPLMGVCLGMQLMFEGSSEGQEPGLGLVPGTVQRFTPEPDITIPHMGWNRLAFTQPEAALWQGLEGSPWAYFVHSYYCAPSDTSWTAATVTHGKQTVTAAIAKGTVMATQFHPEKSSNAGLHMLENYVRFVAKTVKQPAAV
ncbi:MAG: imidazole glycerol phosphate synthase subunit HisH [Synechococcus sp.]